MSLSQSSNFETPTVTNDLNTDSENRSNVTNFDFPYYYSQSTLSFPTNSIQYGGVHSQELVRDHSLTGDRGVGSFNNSFMQSQMSFVPTTNEYYTSMSQEMMSSQTMSDPFRLVDQFSQDQHYSMGAIMASNSSKPLSLLSSHTPIGFRNPSPKRSRPVGYPPLPPPLQPSDRKKPSSAINNSTITADPSSPPAVIRRKNIESSSGKTKRPAREAKKPAPAKSVEHISSSITKSPSKSSRQKVLSSYSTEDTNSNLTQEEIIHVADLIVQYTLGDAQERTEQSLSKFLSQELHLRNPDRPFREEKFFSKYVSMYKPWTGFAKDNKVNLTSAISSHSSFLREASIFPLPRHKPIIDAISREKGCSPKDVTFLDYFFLLYRERKTFGKYKFKSS